MTLDELFRHHRSQKDTPDTPGYGALYERYIDRASATQPMLEIGVARGRSIKAWMEWWPEHLSIHGLDKELKIVPEEYPARVVFHEGDQADAEFLTREFHGQMFSLIVDDGGHRMQQQRVSFETLWPHVMPGGWYVVEDTHSSYWPECTKGTKHTMMRFLQKLTNCTTAWAYHHERAGDERQKEWSYYDRTVEEVHFHSSMVFIKKTLRERP